MTPIRFANDILKPWDELNSLLCQQYAFQPDVSDISRMAGNIAVSIRHQIDFSELSDHEANKLSRAHQVIADSGDFWKHGKLRKEARNSPISVAAAFEYRSDEKYRFLRNIVSISHHSLGEYDFMVISAEAAKFWMSQRCFYIAWNGVPSIASAVYEDTARLKFDPKQCINLSCIQVKFFSKTEDGFLIPLNPPCVRFEVL